jgi:uncharacterized membrane protein
VRSTVLLAIASNLLLGRSLFGSQLYSITDLGVGSTIAINNQGQVLDRDSLGSYLFANGQKQYLPQPNGGVFSPRALNDLGQVAGFVNFGSQYNYDLATYTLGTLTIRTDLPGVFPTAMNDTGQIVGVLVFGYQGFIYSNGVLTPIGALPYAINATGTAVGATLDYSRAFFYQNGQISYLTPPGAVSAVANAINNSGEIVGSLSIPSGLAQVFIYMNGQYQELSSALNKPSEFDGPNAVNDAGLIVGNAETASGFFAWSYDPATGFSNLDNDITSPGWALQTAIGVNDSGESLVPAHLMVKRANTS